MLSYIVEINVSIPGLLVSFNPEAQQSESQLTINKNKVMNFLIVLLAIFGVFVSCSGIKRRHIILYSFMKHFIWVSIHPQFAIQPILN